MMEEEREAARLSPCSELLQHAPFEGNSSIGLDPCGTGLAEDSSATLFKKDHSLLQDIYLVQTAELKSSVRSPEK